MQFADNLEIYNAILFVNGINKVAPNNTAASVAKATCLTAVDKAIADYKPKAFNILLTTNPPVLATITNAMRTDCVAAKTAVDTAKKTHITTMNTLLTEALAPLTVATNIQARVFALLQPILNSGAYNSFWPQLENFMLGQTITVNNKKLACIRAVATSSINRINADPSRDLTRTADLVAVNSAVTTFAPTTTIDKVVTVLQPLRAAADTEIARIRALPKGSPEQQTAIITFLGTQSKTISDAFEASVKDTNTAFTTAVTNVNKVTTPP